MRQFRLLRQVLASVATFGGVAYIAGWCYSYAYLSRFGAQWLTSVLPLSSFLQSSAAPFLALALVLWLNLNDVIQARTEARSSDNGVRHATRWVRLLFLIICLVLLAIAVFFVTKFGFVGIVLEALLASCLTVGILLTQMVRQGVHETKRLHTIIVMALLIALVVPFLLGLLWGLIDSSPASTLPIVCTQAIPCADNSSAMRLLAATTDRVYVVADCPVNCITTSIEWTEIRSIRRP